MSIVPILSSVVVAAGSAKPLDRLSLLLLLPLFGLLSLAVFLMRRRAPPAVAPARRILGSQYEIIEKIGEGGMGDIYRGWDRVLKRPVAVKRLREELQTNPRERERFLKEAEMVASLRHPNIVEIYNIARGSDDTHLVFEYIVGGTVHELLERSPGRHLPPARALEILRQAAEAVDYAHERRVIHRDLKPANIMLADAGWAKVMDFGIARQVQDSLLTTTNTIVGTPFYMAPEQAMGAVSRESDFYSLGVTLYEMLTGAVPCKGPDEMNAKLEGRFIAPSKLVEGLPRAIDAILSRALAPRPEDRYRRCSELYQAAAAALEGRAAPVG